MTYQMMTSDHKVKQMLTKHKGSGTGEAEEDLHEHHLLPAEVHPHVDLYLHEEFVDQPQHYRSREADLDDVAESMGSYLMQAVLTQVPRLEIA